MCGILGLAAAGPVGSAGLSEGLRKLAHRGPDAEGRMAWSGEHVIVGPTAWSGSARVFLGHQRLSILDLSSRSAQPMATADGRYHLVFNGEIYNYRELKAELEAAGQVFRSDGDTEVLLAAWAQWGHACIVRLVGMFAFALLDTKTHKLTLVRDFFGIKPLFYSLDGGRLVFASELPALLPTIGSCPALNPQRLYEYLAHGTCDFGDQTFLKGVRQVPAAHFAEFQLDSSELRLSEYWRLDRAGTSDISFRDAAAGVRERFLESVDLHLRSDVPVGTALSGGIDSSAIACAIRSLDPNAELHTVSFIPNDERLSEESWIDLVAAHIGAVQHKVRPNENDLRGDLANVISVQGEPFAGTSIYAQHKVFEEAARCGLKVMLDGQGADELLAGYIRFRGDRLTSMLKRGRLSSGLRLFGHAIGYERPTRLLYFMARSWLPPRVQARLRTPPPWLRMEWFRDHAVETLPLRPVRSASALHASLQHARTVDPLPSLLRYEDRNSMAFSVESRVPFLTPSFVAFLNSLPEDYLISPTGETKAVFREAMRGIVPDEILNRSDKIGFRTPQGSWLSKLPVPEILDTKQSPRTGMVDRARLFSTLARGETLSPGASAAAWRGLNLLLWVENMDSYQ